MVAAAAAAAAAAACSPNRGTKATRPTQPSTMMRIAGSFYTLRLLRSAYPSSAIANKEGTSDDLGMREGMPQQPAYQPPLFKTKRHDFYLRITLFKIQSMESIWVDRKDKGIKREREREELAPFLY